jgi:hypothetical protein
MTIDELLGDLERKNQELAAEATTLVLPGVAALHDSVAKSCSAVAATMRCEPRDRAPVIIGLVEASVASAMIAIRMTRAAARAVPSPSAYFRLSSDLDGLHFKLTLLASELLGDGGVPHVLQRLDSDLDNSLSDIGGTLRAIYGGSAYPTLISPVGGDGSEFGTSTGTGLGARVDAAFRRILGQAPRSSDPVGVAAAVANAFPVSVVAGARTVNWRPGNYGATSATTATISGAQRSLLTRASDEIQTIQRTLERMRPNLPAPDAEEIDAAKAVILQELDSILREISTEAGPNQARVTSSLETMLRTPILGSSGYVAYLGLQSGFLDSAGAISQVNRNTVAEEQNLSDFILIRDCITSIDTSWTNFKRIASSDLGSGLIKLARRLQAITESCGEIERAMDSVNFGPGDRTVTEISPGGMLISELLSWIAEFGRIDGPKFISSGGRRGIQVIWERSQDLQKAAFAFALFISRPGIPPSGPPAALRQPRVTSAIGELLDHLQRLINESSNLR